MVPEGYRGEPVEALGGLVQQVVAYCKNTTVHLGSWSFTFWEYIWWEVLAFIIVLTVYYLIQGDI